MKILLINGLVYDGSTNAPIYKDVLIDDGIIKNIYKDINESVDKVIDCSNLVVAPGFIDAHSHNDFFVRNNEAILPFLKQGITTQIVGNCGFSAYGVNPKSPYKSQIGGSLFSFNNPSTLNEYIKDVEDDLSINIVPLVGHGTTRLSVAGNSSKRLTSEELNEQLSILEENLKQGAFGGSLGLMYEPGMFAPYDELVKYAEVIKKYDGILTVHPRACSKIALGYPLIGKPHIEKALDEVINITKATGVRCEYSHLIFVGRSSWKCLKPMLKKFKKVQKLGYELNYDMYPFTYGASTISVILPDWYLKLSLADRRKPFNRFKLKLIINVTKKLLGIDYSDLIISYIEGHPEYEGRNVAEIAASENLASFDMYIKLVELSNGNGRIMLGKYYNDEIIHTLMNDESSIYMTDAWYESTGAQNGGTYQAFPLFLEKTKNNNIKLENTINKMTGKTADRFKLSNRGYIREGYAADITIFDYEEIKVDQNYITTPPGIKYVIVNGEIVIKDNDYTGVKNGIVITKK